VNDVFCNNKKIAGILAKSVFDFDKCQLILGIGVNINTNPSEKMATSLSKEMRI